MKKRLISILLALCMVLTLLPATVLSAVEGTSKAGDATFTLSALSASCADGHTGELGSIQVTDVDISRWESDKKITIQYDVQYRCTDSSCELYDSDDSFFSYSGEHTFTDTNGEFCHKKISESFAATIPAALPSGATKNFSISFALTSDKGIYEAVHHEQNVNLCTENYYSVRCWECTGCEYFFLNADMSGDKLTKDNVYFPPVGHKLNNIPAKGPTCVAKGTVEYWHCERCGLNFSDEEGKYELTNIETDAPLLPHSYDDNGICSICSFKAAAKVLSKDGNKWYDNIADALTALDAEDAYRIEIGKDCDETITISNAREVYINKGVTVAKLEATDAEGCVVTVINDGTIKELNGYTGKVVLMSAEGTYGKVINQTSGGNVGSFLYSDPEDANKFCYYKNLSNGKWILPAEATANTLSNVKVSYAPMAYIEIAGDGVTGSEGSYAFTTYSGNTVAFTVTAKTADGEDSANVAYKWYYDGQDGTILSEKAELTIENIKVGKRTVVCMATADDYSISAKIVLTVAGEKESQSFTLSVSKTTVGIREKILPLLSVEGIKEDAAITYYLMNGDSPAPESDTVIDENFAFAQTGTGSIYAYTAETDNYAATASAPVSITVTPHANHCICGGMFNHTHENVEWQAWDGKSEIKYEQKWVQVSEYTKQGRYVAYVYLTGNVSANLTVAPKHILYLCLNSYSFTCADPSQPAITLTGEDGKPVELDLCDCVGTGTLGGSNASGGSIRIGAYANATLYSGTLTGNNVSGDGGTLNAGDETKAVQHNGTYGEMPTPIRSGYHFDGWYTEKDGGTKVDANTSVATKEAHTLYARWSEAKFNITLDPNGGTLANTTYEVTYNSPYGELPTPNRAGYDFDGWFTEKDGGTKVEASTVVTAAEPHTLYAHWTAHEHCICGGSISVGDHTGHTPVSYQSWNGKDAISYTNKTAYVYLSQNVTFNSNLVVDGTTLYLCLNGKTFASNGTNKITVNNGGRLVLCDCAGGGTIRGATKSWGGSCVYLYQSTLDIFGGKITGGKVSGNGGGAIALDDSKCVLNIYGGEISDNNGKNSGGAIFLNNKDKKGGTVNIYGGLIANNKAQNGGVIYSSCGGTVNLVGGTITGNNATNGDGGVINMAGGTVTISGAKLTGNTSSRYGGAVYLYNGVTATMTGGEISGNQAASEGGAVHVYGTSTFNLSGGKITGNSSVDGGAIYLNREPSVLNMSGGVISGNTATGNGGGVYIFRTGSVCNLSGGTIEKNTANVGGGIYVNPGNNGQLKISGNPVVKGNTASGDANNVYLPSGKKLSISAAMSSGASIGITTESKNYPVVFSGKYGQDYSNYFFADAADAHVNYNANTELELAAGAKKYNVYIITDDNGTATVSASSATAGTTIQLTATPNNGYHFKEWQIVSGNAEVSNDTFIMPAGNVTVKPVFEAHSFTEEHVEEQYKKSSADCTHNDVYYKTCSCGAVSATETFELPGTALNHDWAEATCTEPKTCRRKGCGATDGNPLGHDLPNDWSRDENKHWHECKRCHAEEDSGEHEYGDDNICDICGYDKTVPHTHSLTLVSANNETCTKDGNKAYYTCDGCDMWFEDANGSIEIADKTAVIIPATGHAPSESWKFDKADHWKDCTNTGCGTIIEGSKAAHTESGWIIDTAPTYFNSGTQHKECTVCHYVTAVGFIPAKGGDIEPSDPSGWTPNPNLPATGDDNTSFIWIALLIICASTAAGTVIYGRRKKQR